jgi:hypothetical protein
MSGIVITIFNKCTVPYSNAIVIFQKNVGSSGIPAETCIAWTVVVVPFEGSVAIPVPSETTVAASDAYGNATPQLTAQNGNRFDMISSPAGNQLQLSSQSASDPQVVEVCNELPVGAINAMMYRDNCLLARKTGFGPGQKAVFAFEPTLCFSFSTQIRPGDMLDATVTADPVLQLSLTGISSADLVMTGGGTGSSAQPYRLTLLDVKPA